MHKPIKDETGFTLIELLVVVMVIGILSAIALPAFLGQQNKGQDAEAKSDVRNIVSHIESCFAETQDYNDCDGPSEIGVTGINLITYATYPSAGQVTIADTTRNTYVLQTQSKSGMFYGVVKASDGTVSRMCGDTSPSSTLINGATGGGCKSNNTW